MIVAFYMLLVIGGLALAFWLAYKRRFPSNRGTTGHDHWAVERGDEATGTPSQPSVPPPVVLRSSITGGGEAVVMGMWRTERGCGWVDEETGTGRSGAWGRETRLREYSVVQASGEEGVDGVQSVREFV
jgi:hypothetical protein